MKKNFLLSGILFVSGLAFSQVGVNTATPQATLDVVGKPTVISSLDGVIAPRLTGEQLRAKSYTVLQQGALVYVTAADIAPAGQTVNVINAGYYYFDGTLWQTVKSSTNIYNTDGSLTNSRTLTLNDFSLNFTGTNQTSTWDPDGRIIVQNLLTNGGEATIGFLGGNDSNFYIQQFRNGDAQMLASGNSTRLVLGTGSTTLPSDISFSTTPGGNVAGQLRMFITPIGNVKIGDNNVGTEKLDVDGIARIHQLPLNGAANAHNTTSSGGLSAVQDQTFTATRTVVADNNGVLGYVNSLPSDAGTSRAVVITNAPGTQNVGGQFIPNAAIGQFTNESLDVYNAWNNNVFTVPANMGGIYIIVMQNSNTHVSTGTATPTWHTAAYYEKSTDGGTSWNTMIRHTYADLAGTIVDNGNTLYWTGFLNVGDQVRVRFSCNATTNNIVNYGGLSITKLAQ
ncbi:hypothetical protein [Chryseobacterium limigenitum]|uniref:Uncharacterized protein n=1 Tax=Chryseobacterium limigenitum TaxID=1612149 RepID=A0A1K2IU49_9FLAO|nr:hypothetical protein [Chryseobacterium limigenitum]SFZ95965.1 hypothetical protein SAMN05216324_11474 [Chryseobacterium limigenitum]